MMFRRHAIFFATMILCLHCSRLEGDFGFKTPFDDHFKKIQNKLEIKHDEKREWVFVFKNISEPFDAGVFIMKKEIVWVEAMHRTQKITKDGNVIYGVIENLPQGQYKIIITDGKNIIGEKEFFVYSDDEIE